MIYTLTLNPSIDYFIAVDKPLMETEVNRAAYEKMKAGGKGLNVSKILDTFEITSKAIVLLGGFTGDYIKNDISNYKHIHIEEVSVKEANRINVKIHHEQKALNVNGNGPIGDLEIEQAIFNKLSNLKQGDYVMVCGNIIRGMKGDFIIQLSQFVQKHNAKLILDMELLNMSLLKKCKPYLIKPNLYEFKLIMNKSTFDSNHLKSYLKELLSEGVDNILLSLGEQGAVFANETGIYQVKQPSVVALNTVGSGDAMLATFVAKLTEGKPIDEALLWGCAAGIATVTTFEDIQISTVVEHLENLEVSKESWD